MAILGARKARRPTGKDARFAGVLSEVAGVRERRVQLVGRRWGHLEQVRKHILRQRLQDGAGMDVRLLREVYGGRWAPFTAQPRMWQSSPLGEPIRLSRDR